MRRVCSVLLLAAATVVAGAWDDEPQTTLEFGLASRIAHRGIERARAGAQGAVGIAAETFWADVRVHQSWRGSDERFSQLALGYHVWRGESASVEASGAHYRFGGGGASLRHSTELGLRFNAPSLHGFAPSVSYHRDWRLDADSGEARLTREVALTRWGAFLEWSVFAGFVRARNVQPDGGAAALGDSYTYFGADARLPYRVGERTMIVLAAHASGTDGASGAWTQSGRAGAARVGGNLSVTFDF